ncbi:hypothetical protein [Sphingopyxis granuli]|uniref:hypothetical protein n=1 Tax=Sphingopyxis granuli TaxID=267128 RepID=UPI001BAEFAA6|nr:hypothetical protein [Sphingopyxis granuli]QUM70856.1 hypothetical protein ICN83_10620 [Sphingopyxis granuli]
MTTHTTSAPEGKSPAPTAFTALTATPTSPLDRLELLFAANERQGVLLETIDEKIQLALGMEAGEIRDKEFEQCWLLLWTAREIHGRLHCEIGSVVNGLFAMRKKGGAA